MDQFAYVFFLSFTFSDKSINQGLTFYFIMQLENLELAFNKVKQKLVVKKNEEHI
jgi:hypothetical protein